MLEYVFIAFIAVFCIQFIYYVFIFGSFSFSKIKTSQICFNKPVSVLICAKNEVKKVVKRYHGVVASKPFSEGVIEAFWKF